MIIFAKPSCNYFLTPNARMNVISEKNLICAKVFIIKLPAGWQVSVQEKVVF